MNCFIGIDGGGTKTAIALKTNEKTYYLRKEYGVNPNQIGREESAKRICDGIFEILSLNGLDVGCVKGIFAGVAGGSTGDFNDFLKNRLDTTFPYAVCGASHDGINVLSAAFGENDGAIVISGTGSVLFARHKGEIHRIGGYLTYDINGNGYEIGRRAISHYFEVYDGRKPKSYLSYEITKKAGGNPLEKLGEFLCLSPSDVASYSLLVFDAVAHGDIYADKILNDAALYICDYIKAASNLYEGDFDVCLSGSIAKNEIMTGKIIDFSPKSAHIFTLETLPEDGAVKKAEFLHNTK